MLYVYRVIHNAAALYFQLCRDCVIVFHSSQRARSIGSGQLSKSSVSRWFAGQWSDQQINRKAEETEDFDPVWPFLKINYITTRMPS